MKKMIVAAIALALTSPLVFAGPQQEKMKECSASAKTQDLKGDARKSFMKECLSAKKPEDKKPEEKSAPTTQQNKMKQCNQEAGDKALKGDDRKKFMSDCLKK
ncbi:MAG: PsiF family protein [Sulfuricella sp.]